MALLADYHAALGPLIHQFEGTLDRFSGDGMMVFFNDPVPCPDPAAACGPAWRRDARGVRSSRRALAATRPAKSASASASRRALRRWDGSASTDRYDYSAIGTVVQPRRAALRRGEGRADPAEPTGGDRGCRIGAADTGGRAFAQGIDPARGGVRCRLPDDIADFSSQPISPRSSLSLLGQLAVDNAFQRQGVAASLRGRHRIGAIALLRPGWNARSICAALNVT